MLIATHGTSLGTTQLPFGNGTLGSVTDTGRLRRALKRWGEATGDFRFALMPSEGATDLGLVQGVLFASTKIDGVGKIVRGVTDLLFGLPIIGSKLRALVLGAWGPTVLQGGADALAAAGYPQVKNALATAVSFVGTNSDAIAAAVEAVSFVQSGVVPPTPPATFDISKIAAFDTSRIVRASSSYPPGTLYAFSPKLGKYRVAVPKLDGGLGYYDLGAVTHVEQAPIDTAPSGQGLIQTTEDKIDAATGKAVPWYKTTAGMIGIGVGVLGVGYLGWKFLR